MSTSFIVSQLFNSNHADDTTYQESPVGDRALSEPVAEAEMPIRVAGTFKNLCVYVSLEQHIGVLAVAVNRTATSLAITTSGPTGLYEDTSNTAAVIATDEMNLEISSALQSGSNRYNVVKIEFTPTSDEGETFLAAHDNGGVSFSTTSGTEYCNTIGRLNEGATEDVGKQLEVNEAGTWKNLSVYVDANPRSTNSDVASRIGGVDGNLAVTITLSTTGLFEDLVSTDAVANGALINWRHTNGTGSGTQTATGFYSNFNRTGTWDMGPGLPTGHNMNDNLTRFDNYGGAPTGQGTEATTQFTSRTALTVKNLQVYVLANTLTSGTADIISRVNTADGNLAVSYAFSVTGRVEDVSNTDSIVAGDEMDLERSSTLSSGGWSVTLMTVQHVELITAPELSWHPEFPEVIFKPDSLNESYTSQPEATLPQLPSPELAWYSRGAPDPVLRVKDPPGLDVFAFDDGPRPGFISDVSSYMQMVPAFGVQRVKSREQWFAAPTPINPGIIFGDILLAWWPTFWQNTLRRRMETANYPYEAAQPEGLGDVTLFPYRRSLQFRIGTREARRKTRGDLA